jgi:hypothetical protein
MAINQISWPQANINSQMDFSPLAKLGDVYRASADRASQEQTLASLGSDPNANAAILMRSGQWPLVQAGISQQNEATRLGFLSNADKRAAAAQEKALMTPKEIADEKLAALPPGTDPNSPFAQRWVYGTDEASTRRADEELQLRRNADVREAERARRANMTPAEQAAEKIAALPKGVDPSEPWVQQYLYGIPPGAGYSIHVQEDAAGNKSLVRVKNAGPEGPIGGPPGPQNNPLVSGKMNADQSKAAGFTDRMSDAHKVITANEDINEPGFDITQPTKGSYVGGMLSSVGAVRDSPIFNSVIGAPRQQTIQAQRNFVNAILRKESGAAISQSEFNNAEKQYFPQPGDGPEVIAQKRQNRMAAMQSMAREAGAGYRPPPEILQSKDQPAPSGSGSGADTALRDARNAIAAGRDPAMVKQRLIDAGIDPKDL